MSQCQSCGGQGYKLGVLGNWARYQCKACGRQWSAWVRGIVADWDIR